MCDFEDYSEEISQRKEELSDEILSRCVTADTLDHNELTAFYGELTETHLVRDWRKLAGKLLTPPPTRATIENLSKCTNSACELLCMWVSSQSHEPKTFDSLIDTLLECKLYSACDELLYFLQNCEGCKIKDETLKSEENPASHHVIEENLPSDVIQQCRNIEDRIDFDVNVEDQRDETSHYINEQQQQRGVAENAFEQIQKSPQRSLSCPARVGVLSKICKALKRPFKRSKSSGSEPLNLGEHIPTHMAPTDPDPPLPPADEIFIVSSDLDNQTQAMVNLKSFILQLKPVKKGELKVRTIHEVDQNGQVATAWLEERVTRAKFVILCFSRELRAIADCHPDMLQLKHQLDYNLKFLMDFLVTGTIYSNACHNPKGKFIPVLLHGHDLSTLILPLRQFRSFCWPREEKQITNYIMNLPEYPMPRQGLPKPLVRKELSY